MLDLAAHAEIRNLHDALGRQQNVVRFYVSVDHFCVVVQVLEAHQQLLGDHAEDVLGYFFHLVENGGQTARIHVLERDRNSVLGQKGPIRLQDVWVLAVVQSAQLRDDRLAHILVIRNEHFFQRDQSFCWFVHCFLDAALRARPQFIKGYYVGQLNLIALLAAARNHERFTVEQILHGRAFVLLGHVLERSLE